ncbi:MAG: hypothetical protein IKE55_05870 [Kiritimatiellae bacterium]|nr:hypothetical protein [Kiritimatiellia bacterium]
MKTETGILAFAGIASVAASVVSAATIKYDMAGSGGWGDTTRWEGGSVPVSGDTAVIPSGRAILTDADKTVFSSVAIDLESSDSILEIQATSVGWGGYLFFGSNKLRGCGTVHKTGDVELGLFYANGNFAGDWILENGIVSVAYEREAFGRVSAMSGTTTATNLPPGRVYVRRGCSLDATNYGNGNDFSLGFKEMHLAGDGDGSGGAIKSGWKKSLLKAYGNVVLDDDARITAANGAVGFSGPSADNPGILDLCGHNLNITGTAGSSGMCESALVLENMTITNSAPAGGGKIVLEGNASYDHLLMIKGGVVFDRNVTIATKTGGLVYACSDAGQPPLQVAAKLEVAVSRTSVAILPATDGADPGAVEWTGDLDIAEGVTCTTGADTVTKSLTFSGALAGSGTLTVLGKGVVRLSGDSSAYLGSICLNDFYNWAGLRLATPASAPSAPSKLTVVGSTVVVSFPAWNMSQYLALANGAVYSNSGVYLASVTIDPEACDGSTCELSLANGQISDYSNVTLGVGGSGTVDVTALPDENYTRFAAWKGSLRFSGAGPLKVGSALATSFNGASEPGEILFDGAQDVDVGTGCFWIGVPYLVPEKAQGKVTVRNSCIRNHATEAVVEHEGFKVGVNSYGRLVVENSFVTNKLAVGVNAYGRSDATVAKNTAGEFLLKSGYFCAWGPSGTHSADMSLKIGDIGHGYVQVDGGTLFCRSCDACIGCSARSTGVVVRNGGEIDTDVSSIDVGTHMGTDPGPAVGQYWIKGGTAHSRYQVNICGYGVDNSNVSGSQGCLTIDGTNSSMSVGEHFQIGMCYRANAILNLINGGTLHAKTFIGSSEGRAGKSYVNFNGGVYDFIGWGGSALFGRDFSVSTDEIDRPVTRVTVYAKGGTIVMSSSDKSHFLGKPITAPTGKGVGAIPWSDTQTVFRGCPAVVIVNDGASAGSGASAMANYDAATGRVGGFTVTSPGNDYTAAKAIVMTGPTTNAVIDLTASLVDNDTSGGMTFEFTHEGLLKVDQASTYRGETVLKTAFPSATLDVQNKDAFAASSAIKLMGGILKINSYTLDDLTAPFKFMGGAVSGDAGSYVIPEGKMVIDMKDILAGESYTVANNSNLTLPNSVAIWNAEDLDDPDARYTLLTLPNGYSGAVPSFTGVPVGWHVTRVANKIRLCCDCGGRLIFR